MVRAGNEDRPFGLGRPLEQLAAEADRHHPVAFAVKDQERRLEPGDLRSALSHLSSTSQRAGRYQ
jgi:hypothetical protein